MFTRDALLKDLKANICKVVFTKKNGDVRVMKATLIDSYLPPLVESQTTGVKKEPNPDLCVCFDLDKKEWRSFRIDSVTTFEVWSE